MTKARKGDSNAWNSAVSQAKDVIQKGVNSAWQHSAPGKEMAARKQAKAEDAAEAHRERVDQLRENKPNQRQGSRKGEVSNIKDHEFCHRPANIPEVANKVVSGMKRTISVKGEYEDGLPNADTMLGSRKGSRKGAMSGSDISTLDDVRNFVEDGTYSSEEALDYLNGMDAQDFGVSDNVYESMKVRLGSRKGSRKGAVDYDSLPETVKRAYNNAYHNYKNFEPMDSFISYIERVSGTKLDEGVGEWLYNNGPDTIGHKHGYL